MRSASPRSPSSALMLQQLEFCRHQMYLPDRVKYFDAKGEESTVRMIEMHLQAIKQAEDARIRQATAWADSEVDKLEAHEDNLNDVEEEDLNAAEKQDLGAAAKEDNKENSPFPKKVYPNTTPMSQPTGKLNMPLMPQPTLVVPENYLFRTTPEGYPRVIDWASFSVDHILRIRDTMIDTENPMTPELAYFKEYKKLYFKIYNMLAKDQLRVSCAKFGVVTYGNKEDMVIRLVERAIRNAARGYAEVEDKVGVVRITPPPEGPLTEPLVLMDLAEEGLALDEDGYPIALNKAGNPVTLDDLDGWDDSEDESFGYFRDITVDEVAGAMTRPFSTTDHFVDEQGPNVNGVLTMMGGLSIADSTADIFVGNLNTMYGGRSSVYQDDASEYDSPNYTDF